jgi:hypothetical protein
MLEKQKGVSVAMPFCDIGVVEVWTTRKGALTEPSARKVIETNKKFTVKSFTAKTPAKARKSAKKKKKKAVGQDNI